MIKYFFYVVGLSFIVIGVLVDIFVLFVYIYDGFNFDWGFGL